jgi:hypothetical protein
MSRLIQINEDKYIVCESVGTRYGFRHDAKLFVNGYEVEKAKICYYNRTWEAFQFQTVVLKLIEKTDALTEAEKELFKATFNR